MVCVDGSRGQQQLLLEGGPELRNAGNPWKLEKRSKLIPYSCQKKCGSASTWILDS